MTKTFRGDCMGVKISERGPNDRHLIVTLEVEDDGSWSDEGCFSSHWLDELIEQLECARSYLKTQTPDINDGVQYGWKTKGE